MVTTVGAAEAAFGSSSLSLSSVAAAAAAGVAAETAAAVAAEITAAVDAAAEIDSYARPKTAGRILLAASAK